MDVIALLPEAVMVRRAACGRPARPRPPYPLVFPTGLVERATAHLQVNGRLGLEQLALWSGYPTADGVVIAGLLLPETEATWGWVHILPDEQRRIVDWLRAHGQLLFAESHTHGDGPRATELSDEDRRHPAGRQDGFLTIIVPGYARRGIDFARAGVWECRALEWAKLPTTEVVTRLRVVSDEEARNAIG